MTDEAGKSTGQDVTGDLEIHRQEENTDKASKNSLIDGLRGAGKITDQYANLLRSIHTSTFGAEGASLSKVKAVIALKETLGNNGIAQKHAAYIGSGLDWHFPVALGARDIAMIDPMYQNPEDRQRLLKSVREFDPEAKIDGEEDLLINFAVDIGEGMENVTLHLDKTDVNTYEPQLPLGFVLEFRGPSAIKSNVPILENIARGMADDGLVLNFDYIHEAQYTPDIGMEEIGREGFRLYRVTNQNKLIDSSMEVVAPPELSLDVLQTVLKSRQKK